MFRKKISISALLLIFAAIGIVVIYSYHRKTPDPANFQAPAVKIAIAEVKEQTITVNLQTVAQVTANQEVNVSPEISGQIREMLVSEGQWVEKGTPLMKLSAALLENELKIAQAELELNRIESQRTTTLLEKKAVSSQHNDQVNHDLTLSIARYHSAKEKLDSATIRAPFSGFISNIKVSTGEHVDPGKPLLTLTDSSELSLSYQVPEKYIPSLALGQDVSFLTTPFPNRIFRGKVKYISPTIDPDNKTLVVKARVTTSDPQLRPGGLAKITHQIGQLENVLVVPRRSIIPQLINGMVYVEKDGVVSQRIVETGRIQGDLIEIRDGLKLGEYVVTAGQQKLMDGAAIQISNSAG